MMDGDVQSSSDNNNSLDDLLILTVGDNDNESVDKLTNQQPPAIANCNCDHPIQKHSKCSQHKSELLKKLNININNVQPKLGRNASTEIDLSIPSDKASEDDKWFEQKFGKIESNDKCEINTLLSKDRTHGVESYRKIQEALMKSLCVKRRAEQQKRREMYNADNFIESDSDNGTSDNDDNDGDDASNIVSHAGIDSNTIDSDSSSLTNENDNEENITNDEHLIEHNNDNINNEIENRNADGDVCKKLNCEGESNKVEPNEITNDDNSGHVTSLLLPNDLSHWLDDDNVNNNHRSNNKSSYKQIQQSDSDNNNSELKTNNIDVKETPISHKERSTKDVLLSIENALNEPESANFLNICSGDFIGNNSPPQQTNPIECNDYERGKMRLPSSLLLSSSDEDNDNDNDNKQQIRELKSKKNLSKKKSKKIIDDSDDEDCDRDDGYGQNEHDSEYGDRDSHEVSNGGEWDENEDEFDDDDDNATDKSDIDEAEVESSDDELRVFKRIENQSTDNIDNTNYQSSDHASQKGKNKWIREYLDDEASLSGDDVDNGIDDDNDSDNNDNEYEAEEGDNDENIDLDDIKSELHKQWLKQQQDEDDRKLLYWKEKLLEDGDLHTVTNRRFRFKLRNDREGNTDNDNDGDKGTGEDGDKDDGDDSENNEVIERQRTEKIRWMMDVDYYNNPEYSSVSDADRNSPRLLQADAPSTLQRIESAPTTSNSELNIIDTVSSSLLSYHSQMSSSKDSLLKSRESLSVVVNSYSHNNGKSISSHTGNQLKSLFLTDSTKREIMAKREANADGNKNTMKRIHYQSGSRFGSKRTKMNSFTTKRN